MRSHAQQDIRPRRNGTERPVTYDPFVQLATRLSRLEEALISLARHEFGDVEGHPFHGNQWTGGVGGSPEYEKAAANLPGADAALRARMRDTLKQVMAGEKVIIKKPEVVTLIDEMHKMVGEAHAKGKEVDVNLCNVTVEDTNYFCSGNLGKTRIEMPQLSTVAADLPPNAPALKLPVDSRGEIALTDAFAKYLGTQGVGIKDTTVDAGKLRATQSELDLDKITDITNRMLAGTQNFGAPIYTSNDGYVLDGHHRWVAAIERDALDDKVIGNGSQIPVRQIDMPMHELLPLTLGFTTVMGVPQRDMKDNQ